MRALLIIHLQNQLYLETTTFVARSTLNITIKRFMETGVKRAKLHPLSPNANDPANNELDTGDITSFPKIESLKSEGEKKLEAKLEESNGFFKNLFSNNSLFSTGKPLDPNLKDTEGRIRIIM